MKRVLLFLATNLAVVLVLGIVLTLLTSALGIQHNSIPYILVLAAVFGFGGSILSLQMSKWVAKRSMGLQVIEQPRDETETWLMETVARQAQQAGIKMPEVAVYSAPEMNAFATGPSRNNSLVAVSTGLMYGMNRDEVEAVLAHEVSHVANGDMVTMALIQGVVNTFVIFAARLIAGTVSNVLSSGDEEGSGEEASYMTYFLVSMVLEMVFGILASFIVMYFSRQREFRADAGGAALAGRNKMIAALERLRGGQESQMPATMAAFGISGKRSMSELMMSHPPLEKRIAQLQANG
ncbi:Heat shock protein. Metallo peptidase. MEROPS family M48B [Ferrimonas sediminum]|uniref:Protease HtpX n=1 Tax=Ferrimonas sediminum TaxID=718193 RepID=A0A1G8R9N0_9GAMM|nr:protease HtpX [Ferrimonas sediminum]SDJ13668.1 Heat shock protein. Metallo peptidase. MEROPS family M48B [Ferrimonas sediminum]